MPVKQTLFMFREGKSRICCFAATPSKKKLPPTSDPEGWVFVRQLHLEPGEPPRGGFDADDVQAEVVAKGFAIRELKSRSGASQS